MSVVLTGVRSGLFIARSGLFAAVPFAALSRAAVLFAALSVAALSVGASAPSGPPVAPAPPQRPTQAQPTSVRPSNISRLAPDFPAGYELGPIKGARTPARYWGFGDEFTSDPAQCAALADPVTGDAPPAGLAGSGAGGIIYAVVVASASPPVADPGVIADCARFSMLAAPTSGTAELIPAPQIDDVPTVAMTTAAHTVVEGGTVTDTQIQTVTAYLGDYLAFVVVVTDPGAAHPALPPEFAARLLVKAVAALRG